MNKAFEQLPEPLRTRIAPTPSGFLHEGNLLNFALIKSIVAKYGGAIDLRIDDLDRARFRSSYLQDIFNKLHALGIVWQSGPNNANSLEESYSQSFRIPRYTQVIDQLIAADLVYACTCSRQVIQARTKGGDYPGMCRRKSLPLNTPNAALRFRIGEGMVYVKEWNGGRYIDLATLGGDPIIRRRDGLPAYHIASLADDVDQQINFIVRGADLLQATAMQLHIAEQLKLSNFQQCVFMHHALIQGDAGKKLSKSAGIQSEPLSLLASEIEHRAELVLRSYLK